MHHIYIYIFTIFIYSVQDWTNATTFLPFKPNARYFTWSTLMYRFCFYFIFVCVQFTLWLGCVFLMANHCSVFLLFLCFYHVSGESHTLGDDVDFDNVPGLGYELRVPVVAGKEQCFYQLVQAGANFYVSFQVRNWVNHVYERI